MSDAYQATYDAVRSRLSNCDIGAAVSEAFSMQAQGIPLAIEAIKQEYVIAAIAAQRPSVLFRPALSIDGSQWCALYGENLQDGVAGFGDSPAQAMDDFDANWSRKLENT